MCDALNLNQHHFGPNTWWMNTSFARSDIYY